MNSTPASPPAAPNGNSNPVDPRIRVDGDYLNGSPQAWARANPRINNTANVTHRPARIVGPVLALGLLATFIAEVPDQKRLIEEMGNRAAVPGRNFDHYGVFGKTNFTVYRDSDGCRAVNVQPKTTGWRLLADTLTTGVYNQVVTRITCEFAPSMNPVSPAPGR